MKKALSLIIAFSFIFMLLPAPSFADETDTSSSASGTQTSDTSTADTSVTDTPTADTSVTGTETSETRITETGKEKKEKKEKKDKDDGTVITDPDITDEPVMSTMSASSSSTAGGIDNTYQKDPLERQKKLGGGFEVGEFTGAGIYRYPIDLPAGRNGMTPTLNLTYNSQDESLDFIAGYHWSVSQYSISRFNKKGVEKMYDRNDFTATLPFESGELIEVSLSGDHYGEYAMKDESGNFAKYEYLSDNTWLVTDKSGVQYKFGTTADYRQYDPSDASRTYQWMLEEIRDPNDNFIRYSYYKADNHMYPKEIFYTGYGSSDGIFKVKFLPFGDDQSGTARAGAHYGYDKGFRTDAKYLITDIEIYVNNQRRRKYDIDYTTVSPLVRKTIGSITDTGYDINNTPVSLPPTTFDYTPSAVSWQQTTTQYQLPADVYLEWCNEGGCYKRNVVYWDMTGDGLLDFEYTSGSSPNISYNRLVNDGNGGWIHLTGEQNTQWVQFTDNGLLGVAPNVQTKITDFDGDAHNDLVSSGMGFNSDRTQVIPWSGIRLDNGNTYTDTIPIGMASIQWTIPDNGAAMADFNGDGLPDIVQKAESAYIASGQATCLNQDGQSCTLTDLWQSPFSLVEDLSNWMQTRVGYAADCNYDGLADLKYTGSGGGGWMNDGKGGWTTEGGCILGAFQTNDSLTTRSFDANGDGLTDVVVSYVTINGAGYDTYTNSFQLNTGSGWEIYDGVYPHPNSPFPYPLGIGQLYSDWNHTAGLEILDLNGDLLPDIIQSLRDESNPSNPVTTRKVYLNTGSRPYFLKTIHTPTGGEIGLEYKTSPQYLKADNTLANPDLPLVVTTVSKVTTDDGMGNTSELNYFYEDGHYYYSNPHDREYAGFRKVTKTDGLGYKTINYYHQSENSVDDSANGEYQDHISKKGRVYRTEVYDDAENPKKISIQKWNRTTLTDQDPDDERNFVALEMSATVDYGENAQAKSKMVSYLYDAYGNPVTVTDYGRISLNNWEYGFTDLENDKITTQNSYAVNTTDHILSYPSQSERKDQANNTISLQKFYYDNLSFGEINEGNLTKNETYKNASEFLTSQTSYNDRGMPVTVTNPRNYTTTTAYDTNYMYPLSVTNAKNQTTSFVYDSAFGIPTQVTDPNGGVSQTVLDGFGRVTEQKVKDTDTQMKTVKTMSYNLTASPVYIEETAYPNNTDTQSNPIQITKRTYFDGLNRPIQIKNEAEGSNYIQTSMTYDERGNVKEEYLPKTSSTLSYETITTSDPKTSYTYDALGRVKTATNSLGTTTTNYYDWWTKVTDMNGKRKDFYSDARGNLVQVKEYIGSTPYATDYGYDQNNFLTQITNSEGKIKNMTYNLLGWKLSEELFHASGATPRSYSFTYDDNGNILTSTDAKSQTLTYTYDELDRPLTENTNEVVYVYDTGSYGIGRLTSVTSAGAVKAYQYNILGQVTQESKTINSTQYDTSFTYDIFGSPLSITYPDSSTVTYAYNNAGQLEQIPDYVTDFDYSPIGSVSEIHYSNGAVTTNTYDPAKLYRLTDKQTTIGGSDIQDIAYTFDPVGNITNITDTSDTSASKTASYGYDDLHRLTSATVTNTGNSQNYTRTYTYSPTGNILTKSDVGSYTYSDTHPHAVTTAGSQNFTYDANGSLLTDGTWTHTYDTRNRLTSSAKTGETISYTYDEGKTRVTKNDGSKTVTYVNDYYEIDDTTPRKFIMAGGLKIATVEPGGSGGSSMPSDTNLVGYWKFDEGSGTTALDSSGNNNNGTLVGDTSYTTGVSGTALDFDGSGDYVDTGTGLGNLLGNNVTDFSVSLWLKADTVGSQDGVFYIGSFAGGYGGITYRIYNQAITWIAGAGGAGNNGSFSFTDTSSWHHVVLSYDGVNMKMYVDTEEKYTGPYSTPLNFTNLKTVIGAYWSSAYPFDGKIDEVRVYNTAVNPAQVTALYNDPIQLPSDTNLVGYWKLDEGSGTTAIDSSGNGNDGALSDVTYTTGVSGTAGSFNAATSYGLVSDDTAIQNIWDGGGSVSFWINPNSAGEGNNSRILDKNGSGSSWLISLQNESSGYCQLVMFQAFSTHFGLWKTADRVIRTGAPNHVVLTYAGTAGEIPVVYVNGKEVSMAVTYISEGTRGQDTGNDLYIGNNNGNIFTFDGWIDEVRMYNTALTSGNVHALYESAPYISPEEGLNGYWKFDEGSGTTALDSSGNGNNGTISGAVYTSGISGTALDFDGADDYVKVDDDTAVQNMWDNGGSISFIINADTIGETNGGRLLDKNGAGTGWLVSVTNASNGYCQLQMFYAFSTHFGLWKTTNRPIELGKTTSVIVTYNVDSVSNTPIFYIDGQSVPVTTTYIPIGTRNSDIGLDLYIGNNYSALYSFDGLLDEPRLYSKVLSAGEVMALYQNPSGQQSGAGSYTGGTVFHHTDHLSGSNVATDANGNLIELNDYYPYGDSRIEEKAEGYANDYLFTGQERDEETDLYYYGARYYDPVIGRFTSVDPWAGDISDPQSLNKYSYVRNNPLKYLDPSGNIPKDASIAQKIWSLTTFDNFGKGKGWLASSVKQFASNPTPEATSEVYTRTSLAVSRFIKDPVGFADETWDNVTNDRIPTLDTRVQVPATDLINTIEETEGKTFRISDYYRTFEQQDALYEAGISPVKGGESYHNYGLAIDIAEIADKVLTNIHVSDSIAKIGENLGFEWGGRWGSRDYPHFQMPFGKTTAELKKEKEDAEKE